MDRLDYGTAVNEVIEKPTRGRAAKKRKWREIEALKERQRLMKELSDFDMEDSFDLEAVNY
ncbi:DUF3545 family protein [Paraferrimonas sp. SM1919]|uniref:DUF3545 family protein n=1 Tax=Paraferrimonas sp. SM1919 TaxID=2662263 RepID=UPI0013D3FA54|nr:DUF3545 family protein [Paraferrimonas sp. SM1919]